MISEEIANLKVSNEQLERLIQRYERQFAVDALVPMVYPSLSPPPHGITLPDKEGYLSKLSGSIKKSWIRRLFVLKDDFLFCYFSRKSDDPINVLRVHKKDLTKVVQVTLKPSSSFRGKPEHRPYCLEIPVESVANEEKRKVILLSAESAEEQRDWLYAIRKAPTNQWYKDRRKKYLPSGVHSYNGGHGEEFSGDW